MSLLTRLRRFTLQRIDARSQVYPAEHLPLPAIVFSPHFDDETLGCGGWMIKKRQAGADVRIAFMTDGSRSHPHLMPPEQLMQVRSQEGIAAAQVMGLPADHVIQFGFAETHLNEQVDAAVERVTALLREVQPREIAVPYSGEPLQWSADHRTTTAIVYKALDRYAQPVTVYEYPIWCWFSLPWINPLGENRRTQLDIARNTLQSGFGLRFVRDFNTTLDIRDVLPQKREALNQHRSQMTRLIDDAGWSTLGDVANGQFLAQFMGECERFRTLRYPE